MVGDCLVQPPPPLCYSKAFIHRLFHVSRSLVSDAQAPNKHPSKPRGNHWRGIYVDLDKERPDTGAVDNFFSGHDAIDGCPLLANINTSYTARLPTHKSKTRPAESDRWGGNCGMLRY